MTNQEFLELLYKEAEYDKKKVREAETELQKEFWTNQLDVLLKSIEKFKKETEGTH